eukprot:CAMPEP_0179083998 /NCGR_PEP_ID=MMETSP0796-20121207/37961_1 /TAXON_ID=73915 /ORGANISM="Pyrodinium bahamense, Strain pbaha01" /LENGTH=111 /DNA_ID=CAMNT_0020781411 /DNA_START=517 /DNA_END=849 /DNA_ORIENTATION=-
MQRVVPVAPRWQVKDTSSDRLLALQEGLDEVASPVFRKPDCEGARQAMELDAKAAPAVAIQCSVSEVRRVAKATRARRDSCTKTEIARAMALMERLGRERLKDNRRLATVS